MSEEVTIILPPELAQELDSTGRELLVDIIERGVRDLKIERALDRYARGGISFGAPAHQAGISQSDLARHAYAQGMEPPFSTETLAEEVD